MAAFGGLGPDDPSGLGPYRIVGVLGSGELGRVYLGRSSGGRAFAVTAVREELAYSAEFRSRFARETASVRGVGGEFTAGVVDADPGGRPPWLATAYVPGVSLDEAVRGYGPWPEQSVLVLAAGLASALESIHAAGVVHRGLLPSRVMLSGGGPRLVGFGVSVPGGGDSAGDGSSGTAGDVFALGAVLAFAATGRWPEGAGADGGVQQGGVQLGAELGALPPRLRNLVERCLDEDPGRRPGVAELPVELAEVVGQAPVAEPERWLPAPVAGAVAERAAAVLPDSPVEQAVGPSMVKQPQPDVPPPSWVGQAPPPQQQPTQPMAMGMPAPGAPGTVEQPVSGYAPAGGFNAGPGYGPTGGAVGYGGPAGHAGYGPPGNTGPSAQMIGGSQQPGRPSRGGAVVAAVLGAVLVVALLVWLVPKIGSDGEPRAKASPSTSRTTSKDSEAGGQPGAAPAAGVREAVGGSWEGSYVCAQGKTGMRLAITPTGGDRLKAVFSFFPHPDNPGTPSGSFEMQGTFAEDRLMLQGNRWIKRPTDYQLIDLDARVIEGAPKTISGSVSSGCSTFTVDRQQG